MWKNAEVRRDQDRKRGQMGRVLQSLVKTQGKPKGAGKEVMSLHRLKRIGAVGQVTGERVLG